MRSATTIVLHHWYWTSKNCRQLRQQLDAIIDCQKEWFADALYLDPKDHKYIDEFGGANFYGITKDGQFQTPKSDSILPSITKRSILKIAKDLDLDPVETKIPIEDVDRFAEAGAMGTAAVISPVGSLTYQGKKYVFGSETEAGPITQNCMIL